MRILSITLIAVALLLPSWSATAVIGQPSELTARRSLSSPSSTALACSEQDLESESDTSAFMEQSPAGEITKLLGARIDSILLSEPLASSAVGLLAVTLRGDTLACFHPHTRLVPASNIKLLTTGVALRVLGSQFRFTTSLGYSGNIDSNGSLNGDLYIIGGGDPTTGARVSFADPVGRLFSEWHKILLDAGIRSIKGRIVADPRFFADRTPAKLDWNYDDLGAYYGASPTGLNFFENAQNFTVRPSQELGQSPSFSIYYPQTPWLEVSSIATTGQPRSANTIFLTNSDIAPFAQFAGSFPIDRKAYTFEASNRFGALTCAYYFYNYLSERGLSVRDGYADISPTGDLRSHPSTGSEPAAQPQSSLTIIGQSESASLASIIAETNHESDNFFAETLLKMIGVAKRGSDEDESCIKAIQAEFKSMGLPSEYRCKTVDGSGLARTNYVSPSFFVDFLQAMSREREASVYYRSLPTPGAKGTLESKIHSCLGPFAGRLRMKSGSMNGILCYSGYIFPLSGEESDTIVFSILTNNTSTKLSRVAPSIDAIIEALAQQN